jgi:hypothetical protein
MVTPTKDEILAKATEMWFQWQVRQGFTPKTLPEESELKEDICPWTGLSWWETARRELMKSPESIALDEQIRFLEEQYSEAVEKIKERVWDEAKKLIKEAERRAEAAEKARKEEAEKSRRQIEELKAKLGRTPKPFRVVKPFVWGVKWEPGQTLRTVDWEWAFKMVESGYLEPIPEEAAPPSPPKPKELTKDEIAKLEDLFRATLYRELGRVPRDALAEFRVELETVKTLPYEEAAKVIERLALDIAERERAGRVAPPIAPPTVRPPEVAPAPPTAPPPTPIEVAKPPAVPLEPMPWPRRLCYSLDTKVVTVDGIKSVDELREGDLVFSLKVSSKKFDRSGILEIKPIVKIYKMQYNGEMVHIYGKRFDLLVTPEHKVLCCRNKDEGLRFVEAKDVTEKKNLRIPVAPKWRWSGGSYYCKGLSTKSQREQFVADLAELAGWFIGDGHLRIVKKHEYTGKVYSYEEIDIYEPEGGKYRQDLENLLSRIGVKYWKNKTTLGINCHANRDNDAFQRFLQLVKKCGNNAHEKRIPRELLELRSYYLKRLFDGLMKSDGTFDCHSEDGHKRRGCWRYVTVSEQLVRDIIELCMKLGFSVKVREYAGRPHKLGDREIKGGRTFQIFISRGKLAKATKIEKVSYDGIVWCAEVQDNHNMLVIRNGKLCFSGNSSSEINAFWKAFEYELSSVGLNPYDFMEYWVRFRDAWHQDWFHVLRAFKEMIDDIKARKMPRYYPRGLMPVVWKNLPRDAILHLLATKVPQSMDDLIAQLNMHGIYVMPQEVTMIVKEEWKKTPRDSWLEVTPKDYIKKILGVDPEDP